MSNSTSLISTVFPVELVLRTIEQISFSDDLGKSIANLALAHPRFQKIIQQYEKSLIKKCMHKELPHATTDFPTERTRFTWLAQCIRRYDTIDDVMAILVSELNHYALARHNMALANTGLLLLYRLADIEEYSSKVAFIKSLPRDPLTAIYVVINNATLTARYHGNGAIHQRIYGRFMDALQFSLRQDIEFCFGEGILNLGPQFLSDALLHHDTTEAEATLMNLYHDLALHDWTVHDGIQGDFTPPITEGPHREPGDQRTLSTTLLEKLAQLSQYPLEEVRNKLDEELARDDHSLAYLNLIEKAKLVQGMDGN